MKRLDIKQGDKFGRLTVIKEVEQHIYPSGLPRRKFLCRCECGNVKTYLIHGLVRGTTKSCGCYHIDIISKSNKYNFKNNIIEIMDSKGNIAIIDKEDYDKIKDICFYMDYLGYFVSAKGKMHRIILNAPKDYVVDHINHNPADNRKCNLRICTPQQNAMNKKAKGYFYDKKMKKWKARIEFKGKEIHLGYHDTEEKAKEARQQAVNKYFGEFAYRE